MNALPEECKMHIRYKNKNVLPSEVILEIYLRLPYKSLMRLKSICKKLYKLTNGCYFINEYRKPRPSDPSISVVHHRSFFLGKYVIGSVGLYDLNYDSYTYRTCIDRLPKNTDFKGLLSSNGLLCLYGYDDFLGKENRNLAICNPTTQEIVHLPDYPDRLHFPGSLFIRNQLGFGFHPKINKYMVVQLVHDLNTGRILGCNMLTLELDCGLDKSEWKYAYVDDILLLKCNCNCNCHLDPKAVKNQDSDPRDKPAVCVGGVLYWEFYCRHIPEDFHILLFDLSSENNIMKMILPPPPPPGSSSSSRWMVGFDFHLVELQGNLCFWEMVHSDDSNTLQMVISKLNHRSDCHSYNWSHLYTIKLQYCVEFMLSLPLCIMDDGRRILLRGFEQFHCYDPVLAEESSSTSNTRSMVHHPHLKMFPERDGDFRFPNGWFPRHVKFLGRTNNNAS